MEGLLNQLIYKILTSNQSLVTIALQQRAKFEGWLKFELANELKINYADTIVEYNLKGLNALVDIYSNQSLIELKTPNTSYKANGCINATKPITDNMNGIIGDIQKLRSISSKALYAGGYIAFVMFPLDKKGAFAKHISKIRSCIHTNRMASSTLTISGVDILIFTAKIF